MDKTINFAIPGLYKFVGVNMNLIALMENFPEKFRDEVRINSMYGSFPCEWNGDNIEDGNLNSNDLRIAIDTLNTKGIKIEHTFTNDFISEDLTKDLTGNTILKITRDNQKLKNGVIVRTEELRKHLEENFNELDIVIDKENLIEELSELEDVENLNAAELVDIGSTLNKKLLKENIGDIASKLRIIVNDPCTEENSDRTLRHENNSLVNLKENLDEIMSDSQNEGVQNYYANTVTRENFVSFDDIINKYFPLGITNYKIFGNTSNYQFLIESYVEYLAKPEFKDEIRYLLYSGLL